MVQPSLELGLISAVIIAQSHERWVLYKETVQEEPRKYKPDYIDLFVFEFLLHFTANSKLY